MEKLTWDSFKTMVDAVAPPIYSSKEDESFINVFFILHGILFDCDINKTTDDYTEFQASYRSKLNLKGAWDSNGRQIAALTPFSDTCNFFFRGGSFSGTFSPESVSHIDFRIDQERYIDGGVFFVNSRNDADTVTFQVVDKDNIMGYGINTVLNEFITSWHIPPSKEIHVKIDYPARIPEGLYIRAIYNNTQNVEVKGYCDLFLHWKRP